MLVIVHVRDSLMNQTVISTDLPSKEKSCQHSKEISDM